MTLFASMHNNWLDPDIHLWQDEPECLVPDCEGYCDPQEDSELYVCDECGASYDVDDDGHLTPVHERAERRDLAWEFEMELWRISRHRPGYSCSVDTFFECAPEGDFEWKGTEAGDWHVYCCGEKDCPRQWHMVAYTIEMGRKDGRRWVESLSVDEDGNWDFDCAYDEREGDRPEDFEEFYRGYLDHTWDYFYGWTQYWISAYQTGLDVCDQIWGKADVREVALKSVGDNLKYLYGIIEKRE